MAICCPVVCTAAEPVTSGEDFFEAKIRPILVEHCYECHSSAAKELQGGLRLDTPKGLRRGGESGPVVVAGRVEESLLIEALRYEGLEMPPTGKLPDEVVADFARWIRIGVPDPRETVTTTAKRSVDFESARRHWAYQPIEKPPLPNVQSRGWGTSPIDRFILARLEAKGLAPSPAADRRSLIRRVYFDLIGLPPTFEAVEAFAEDPSPAAFAAVVDRLLASPQYGERWGRHWLDVARYADTVGFALAREGRYPYAYTYRDYVIDAFNQDKPYDRFLVEQLAADRLELGGHDRSLAAMGFLTVGRWFLGREHLIIDDRIDVLTRGMLGMTVQCARCHDHKYDAIPTEDYYALYGVLASSEEPLLLPRIAEPRPSAQYDALRQELAKRQQTIEDYYAEIHRTTTTDLRSRVGDYLKIVAKTLPQHNIGYVALLADRGPIRRGGPERWRAYLEKTRQRHHPIFALWHRFAELDRDDFAPAAKRVIDDIGRPNHQRPLNPLVRTAFLENPPASMIDVAATYGKLLESAYRKWVEAEEPDIAGGRTPEGFSDAEVELLTVLTGEDSPTSPRIDEIRRGIRQHVIERDLVMRSEWQKHRTLYSEFLKLQADSSCSPPRAMVMVDAPHAVEARVFRRGDPNQPGKAVPRRFLHVLSMVDGGKPFTSGSGRLELARAIASRKNPLTARVLVNRVWLHHFGRGLVDTPSNFGVRGEPPTHPKLLDYMAAAFIDGGWSIKALHRAILLSSTYQQQSGDRPAAAFVDPQNELLWRMQPRRLEFEPIRDAMLSVAGRLENQLGGRPVDLFSEPFTGRRSVYGFIDRQDLAPTLRVFDMADPDITTGARPQTTVPQQALFLLNNPFVSEQAQAAVAQVDITGEPDVLRRIAALYRRILSRDPQPDELRLAEDFISAESLPAGDGDVKARWRNLAQALLVSNEFVYVD